MDISRASNFERYVFDLLDRDPQKLKNHFQQNEFRLSMNRDGFVSGKSTHADRLATIRSVYEKHGVMIDPHTADGVKVAQAHRETGVPMICLETALPVKFAATIREALGREPGRPAAFEGLEERPQRFTRVEPDAAAVKRYIEAHA